VISTEGQGGVEVAKSVPHYHQHSTWPGEAAMGHTEMQG